MARAYCTIYCSQNKVRTIELQLLHAKMPFVSPAFIDSYTVERLRIKSCSQCDKLRSEFPHWSMKNKARLHEKLCCRCQCNRKKCDGLVDVSHLLSNNCVIEKMAFSIKDSNAFSIDPPPPKLLVKDGSVKRVRRSTSSSKHVPCEQVRVRCKRSIEEMSPNVVIEDEIDRVFTAQEGASLLQWF